MSKSQSQNGLDVKLKLQETVSRKDANLTEYLQKLADYVYPCYTLRIPFANAKRALRRDKRARIVAYNVYQASAHANSCTVHGLGCALFYKPIWQLTVNERGHYADSEDTFLFKIEDSPDTRLGA